MITIVYRNKLSYRRICSEFYSLSFSFHFCFSAYRNAAEIVQYGVKNNTTFLECAPKSPQASIKWLLQKDKDRRKEVSKAALQQSVRALERH